MPNMSNKAENIIKVCLINILSTNGSQPRKNFDPEIRPNLQRIPYLARRKWCNIPKCNFNIVRLPCRFLGRRYFRSPSKARYRSKQSLRICPIQSLYKPKQSKIK